MEVTVNGKRMIVQKSLPLNTFLLERRICVDKVVVELNRTIIETSEYPQITLKDGDVLEILRFVGGG